MINKLMTRIVEIVVAAKIFLTEARDAYEAERKREEEARIRR